MVRVRLRLLGGFAVQVGRRTVRLPPSAQRVLAFVALCDRPVERSYVAGTLWLLSPEERAYANLRTALWRLRRCEHRLVETSGSLLVLGRGVEVDLREAERLAERVLAAGRADPPDGADAAALGGDLLPDWYEDWLVIDRERHRQLRLGALELLCERLTAAGRLDEALAAGLGAVAAEPLRESAHRAVVRVHLAGGNFDEAVRQHALYARVLHEQLGLAPSPLIEALVAGARDEALR